jgi:predicted nucleic acid-binding protein
VTGRAFVDTNVWVYAVDEADPRKQARARDTLSAAAVDGIVVSPQVMGEFYVTVTRKLATPLPPDAALDYVRGMMRQSVVPLDSKLVEAAIVAAAAWQVSYWDALLVAAARTAGADRLISEDLQDRRIMDGVLVVNPFRDLDAEVGSR